MNAFPHDDDAECFHDFIVNGHCQICFQIVHGFQEHDSGEYQKKKMDKRNVKTVTTTHLVNVLSKMGNEIDKDIMSKVIDALDSNEIQIRHVETAKKVIFAHIYSEMYSRDLPPEELFKVTPNRLMVIMGLTKKAATKSLIYINSSRIRGACFVMVYPYLYLIEFKENNPESPLTYLITDEFIEYMKDELDPETHPLSKDNPLKLVISYMTLYVEMLVGSGKTRIIKDMYNFYGLKPSQVKDTLSTVRVAFAKDFVTGPPLNF